VNGLAPAAGATVRHLVTTYSGAVGIGVAAVVVVILTVRALWRPVGAVVAPRWRILSAAGVGLLIVLLVAIVVLRFAVMAR
jgi:hypothetical protein